MSGKVYVSAKTGNLEAEMQVKIDLHPTEPWKMK
jgi:hypothetical protein